MKSIAEVFKNKKVKIAYYMTGDPTLETSEKVIEKIASKFDIIELGVPFSDPIADGITIQKSALRAMNQKITITEMFKLVKNLRKKGIENPIITMLYYNLILQYGLERFADGLLENGLNGALVPDLPLEESQTLREIFKSRKLDFPMLIAPNTIEERAKKITQAASGFIYYVSYTGTTGSKVGLDYAQLKKKLEKLRSFSPLPVSVGFGIKDKESVEKILSFADGAVVGSALIDAVERNIGKSNLLEEFEKFTNQF